MGCGRSAAAAGARGGQRGRRSDHCVPVRTRIGDAALHHGCDGKGATMGILFRNAEAIELLRKVDTLVVDKTGTLTEGKPRLLRSAGRLQRNGAFARSRQCRARQRAPLAAAIVSGAQERGVPRFRDRLSKCDGQGRRGHRRGSHRCSWQPGAHGRPRRGCRRAWGKGRGLRAQGQTVMFVAIGRTIAGIIGVADPIKASTPERFVR